MIEKRSMLAIVTGRDENGYFISKAVPVFPIYNGETFVGWRATAYTISSDIEKYTRAAALKLVKKIGWTDIQSYQPYDYITPLEKEGYTFNPIHNVIPARLYEKDAVVAPEITEMKGQTRVKTQDGSFHIIEGIAKRGEITYYIQENGKLIEVTEEEYDAYEKG